MDDAANSTKKILVIDDEAETNRFVVTALGLEGYESFGVLSGEEGLKALQADNFDLILLDVMMQGLDGIETCRRIRLHDAWAHIPICMITASVDIEKVVASFKAGASGYIVKPFDIDELLAKIAELTVPQP